MRRNILWTPGEGDHAGDVLAGLVDADPVLPAHHTILHSTQAQDRGGLTQSPGHDLAFNVFILMIILRTL